MAKRKASGMVALPSVQTVHRGRKTYYYYVPNRNTSYEGQRIPLGTDATDPEFWRLYKEARGEIETGIRAGTFAALIQEYKNSGYWNLLSQNTQIDYAIYLKRIEAAWGNLLVSGLSTVGVYRLRDKYAKTPAGANHLVSVLNILLTYGMERGYSTVNPASSVRAIKITDEQNATPWTETAYQTFLQTAPEHLRRTVFLGRSTGQRSSDVVRMGKQHRRDDGLDITIRKLRYKRHFVILKESELAEIVSWSCPDVGPWILSPETGQAMTLKALQSAFERFRDNVPELAKGNVYGEPVKLHGLRAMAVCDRRMDGLKHEDIANQLCMSLEMVIRYSRRIDTEALAREANRKREAKAQANPERKGDRLKNRGLQD